MMLYDQEAYGETGALAILLAPNLLVPVLKRSTVFCNAAEEAFRQNNM
jgi:hypothetical protein